MGDKFPVDNSLLISSVALWIRVRLVRPDLNFADDRWKIVQPITSLFPDSNPKRNNTHKRTMRESLKIFVMLML